MFFGKCKSSLRTDDFSLKIRSNTVEFVESWNYLGFHVSSEKGFSFNVTKDLTSFYRSSNSVINALYKPSEEVLMRLLFTNCVPVLTYGCELKTLLAKDMHKMNVAINDSIRKIFGWHRWESVRTLRMSFNYPDIYKIFAMRRKGFLASLKSVKNTVLKSLVSLNQI